MQDTYTIGPRTFVLDRARAQAALEAKRVVGGRQTMTFNLLPLRYGWAYELYRTMKANHWEPEDVPMQRDVEQWRDARALSDVDRWIVRMGIGYFSAAEGIVGDNVLHVVRELVTASELKLVLGRHAHEENIHADSLLYMISSLGIDPYECEAMFDGIPTIVAKNRFVTEISRGLRRDLDLRDTEAKQLLARNVFAFGQCMEGTQFYGLFGMILSLYRQGKLPGIGTMFRYTLRDESNHIELFRRLLLELAAEEPDVWITMLAGTQCTQIVTEAAQNGLKNQAKYLFMPQTCPGASFIGKDKVGGDGSAGDGWWLLSNGVKDTRDPAFAGDPYVQWLKGAMKAKGLDPDTSVNFAGGISYGFPVVQALAIAGQLDGGLNRTNFMLALRSMDMTPPMLLWGIRLHMDGLKDAYIVEAGQFMKWDAAKQTYEPQGEIIDLDGKAKLCAWDQATSTCKA